MEDFRMKLQIETKKISEKIKNGDALTEEDMKILFLTSYLAEDTNE